MATAGGGWNRGDSRQSGAFADFPAVLASLAARGYVVASVDYRLTGEAPFPESGFGSLSSIERSEMGARGRAYVLAHHTYPVLASRFLAALQEARDHG